MKSNIERLGLIWYTPQTYEWARQNMEDGAALRPYAEWLQLAQQAEQRLQREGQAFIRVNLDPGTFRSWCAANGCKVDADGRKRFAAWAAMQVDVH